MSDVVNTTDLRSLADFVMGQSPPGRFVSERQIGIPFLQGAADFGTEVPTCRVFCSRPPRTCDSGDVLLSVRAPVGLLNRADRPYCIGRGLAAVRFKRVNQQYGWHMLCYSIPQLNRVAQGSTFQAVSRSDLEGITTVVLPSCQQTAIAGILDTVDEAIRQTAAVSEKLKKIKAGLLHDLLTRGGDGDGQLRDPIRHPEQFKDSPLGKVPKAWEVKPLGELCCHVGSGITPTGGHKVYGQTGIPFIRSQNVTFDGLLLDDVAFINPSIHEGMRRSEIFPHDVLLNITGASIGRCCPVPTSLGTANVNQHVCGLRIAPKPTEADAVFLSAFLGSAFGQRQIDRLNAGSNRQGLNYSQIRSFSVPWPDVEERRRLAGVLDAHDDRAQAEAATLRKLTLMKQGLMQDLLTGRVRVNVGSAAGNTTGKVATR